MEGSSITSGDENSLLHPTRSDKTKTAAPENPLRNDARSGAGCGCGLLAVTVASLLFGVVAALVKLIAMNVYVMLQVRGTLQMLLSFFAVCAFAPGPRACDAAKFIGETRRRPMLFLRACAYWGFISLWWGAVSRLPVGDATSVVYCMPLFASFFGWLLLGERVPPHVFGCIALSMVGICLITRPSFLFEGMDRDTQYSLGMLLAFGSATMGGLLPVLVRFSKECHWATVEFVASLVSSVVLTPVALVVVSLRSGPATESDPGPWDGIRDPEKLLLLGLVAIVGFAALGLQTCGYQRESAARAAVMTFLEIPCAYLLQYLIFGDPIAPVQGLGMLLVISGGLINGCIRLRSAQRAAVQPSGQRSHESLGSGLADSEPVVSTILT